MRIALLVLCVLAPDLRALELYERMEFKPADAQDYAARRVVELLQKKEHWVGAYSQLAEKFGRFPDDLVVTADFDHKGEALAQAGARKSRGVISFNLEKLTAAQRSLDEMAAKIKAAKARGQRLVVQVPALKIERIIHHELMHVLQSSYDAPPWFLEGMAQLAGEDPNMICGFAHRKGRVQSIDVRLEDRVEVYARGHLFWNWLDSRGLAQRVIELTVFQRRPWKESLIEATQLAWDTIVDTEREWSEKELEKLR